MLQPVIIKRSGKAVLNRFFQSKKSLKTSNQVKFMPPGKYEKKLKIFVKNDNNTFKKLTFSIPVIVVLCIKVRTHH